MDSLFIRFRRPVNGEFITEYLKVELHQDKEVVIYFESAVQCIRLRREDVGKLISFATASKEEG